ncbi:hypothetical protein H1S01_09435 [Heliobacterium chlorum]|uniref:Uncharacterized protein n=1 Tax=Heliobacterium chlorum TaxID=2698 RepID=A0ABR7T596_HELCL|nr:hypothetical protein [Heliobacterium chlorum]MBC9784731.1 hypothetical protein [Heliobacterium chlorum]
MSFLEHIKKLVLGTAKYRKHKIESLFPICYCQSISLQNKQTEVEWLLQDLHAQRYELVDYDRYGDPFWSGLHYRFLTSEDQQRLPVIEKIITDLSEMKHLGYEDIFILNHLYGYDIPKVGALACPVTTTSASPVVEELMFREQVSMITEEPTETALCQEGSSLSTADTSSEPVRVIRF